MPHIEPDPAVTARLEKLVLAGVALTADPSLEGVIHRVVNIAADVIGARFAAIGVLAPDGRTLESFTTRGISDEERARIGDLPTGHGILGLVIREARPIRLPDLTRHPDSHGFPPHHPPMHTFLGVPIVSRRGVFGNLYLTEKEGGEEFSKNDERIAVLLAAMTAAAVENARLHEESARLLEEVHLLQRNRERFFAMVNHELRNALAAVHGWSEMMVRKKDPATVPRAAFEVLDSAQHAVALINDLLDLSRLDEDRLRPVIRPVDPNAVGRRAISRVTPAAVAKAVTMAFDAAGHGPSVLTDASRVEQILLNILGNAIKHTPESGTVRLTVDHDDTHVRYRIDDGGPGLAEGDEERIFDIYVTDPSAESQGVGLGLPLSRRLARLLGGDLRAANHEGGGASFQLELPAARES
ncbi:MAG: ATP-binding protein [Gemmatimonadales bacterium]